MKEILINIDVEDLQSATEFYTAAFSLKRGRSLGEGFLELLSPQIKLYLLEKPNRTTVSPKSKDLRHYERHWTPVHLDFIVESLPEAMERAEKAGATIESDIQIFPYGKIVYAADPFGNGFCLLEFVGQGYDEIADK